LIAPSENKSPIKNILLVIDVKNWCFDNIANQIIKYYSQMLVNIIHILFGVLYF